MSEMNEDLKIEILPTVGEPLSVKTKKQGRIANLKSYKTNLSVKDGMINKKLRTNERLDLIERFEFAKLSVFNICKHAYATEKQKEAARKTLSRMEITIEKSFNEDLNPYEHRTFNDGYMFIRRMTMSFNRRGGLKT